MEQNSTRVHILFSANKNEDISQWIQSLVSIYFLISECKIKYKR